MELESQLSPLIVVLLELLARSKVDIRLQPKIPLILFGMGAWHLPSFVNALKLLADSSSPTFIYFRHEDSLILDKGLKSLIADPGKGTGEHLKPILERAFANENNFIYFTKDKVLSPRDKLAHEFTEYLKRCSPLLSMIGQENFLWVNFVKNLSDPNQLFTSDVTVSLVKSWEGFLNTLDIEECMLPNTATRESATDKKHH